MKHIKRFNESTDTELEELKKFCNDNLAYLIDEGYTVLTTQNDSTKTTQKMFGKFSIYIKYTGDETLSNRRVWEFPLYEVKEEVIPFVEFLIHSYSNYDITSLTMNDAKGRVIEEIRTDIVHTLETMDSDMYVRNITIRLDEKPKKKFLDKIKWWK